MSLEMTRNRLLKLADYAGEIRLGGDMGTEVIEITIPFYDRPQEAEAAYNALLDVDDTRCDECGRYIPQGLCWGMCLQCAKKAFQPDKEPKQ